MFPFGDHDQRRLFAKIQAGIYKWPQRMEGIISDDAKRFVSRLLKVDPEDRPSAQEALADRWLQQEYTESDVMASTDRVNCLNELLKITRERR
jgi:calcium/calmodulin-dependent protein kinase I